MSEMAAKAAAYFSGGYSCSQAVLAAFGDVCGLDRTLLLRLGLNLGGGGQTAGICGAVSGALLVIGLCDNHNEPQSPAGRRLANDRAREFTRLFRERHGHVDCRDLLGCDISAPEGRQCALAANIFAQKCPGFVADAATILCDIGCI